MTPSSSSRVAWVTRAARVTRAVHVACVHRVAHAARRPAVQLLLFGVVAVGLGYLGVALRPANAPTGLWWPAAGLAAAVLLLSERRHHVHIVTVIVVAGTLSNLYAAQGLAPALLLALVNPIAPVVIDLVLRHRRTDPLAFGEPADLVRLLAAVLLGSVVAGLVAAGLTAATSPLPFMILAGRAAAAHAAPIFLVLPFVLRTADAPTEAGRTELVAQWLAIPTVTWLVFGQDQALPAAFLLLPVLLWPALRSTMRTTVAQLIVATVLVVRLSQVGLGPFALSTELTATSFTMRSTLIQLLISSLAVVLLAVVVTVGQRRALLLDIARREELFRVGFTRSLLGQVLLRLDPDGLRIVELNGVAARLLGETPPALIGSRLTDNVLSDDRPALACAVADMVAGVHGGWRGEVRIPQRQTVRRAELAISPVVGSPAAGALFTLQLVDVTDRRAAEDRLTELALHDHLTGLANRLLLEDRLDVALVEAASGLVAVGVLFIDLDDFKAINDTDGHDVGDAVLIELATRLRRVVRASDTVARIGGDEFVVVCPGLVSIELLEAVRQRIEAALRVPIPIEGLTQPVGASIGAASSRRDDTGASLVARADQRMYARKARTHAERHGRSVAPTP